MGAVGHVPLSVTPRARFPLQACYLSYNLLLLASNVVGTENLLAEQRVSSGRAPGAGGGYNRGGTPC